LKKLTTLELDIVISVCCLRDAETWKIASQYIVRNILAERYKVFVPDNEVEAFKVITASPFEVVGESIYTKNFSEKLRERLPKKIQDQFGWYLQQLIKLAALSHYNEYEVALIWDADTIPLRQLNFIDSNGSLVYYKSDESHSPYFDTVDRLLGLKKNVNFSFISQSFVIRNHWMKKFIIDIESKHNTFWIDAILDAIDFQEGNGFSEYETLGTFISHYFSKEAAFSDRKWLRTGNSEIGDIAFLEFKASKIKLNPYDFVSFEKWDKKKPYFWRVQIPYLIYVYLPRFLERKC
jgi:hypothetical protein